MTLQRGPLGLRTASTYVLQHLASSMSWEGPQTVDDRFSMPSWGVHEFIVFPKLHADTDPIDSDVHSAACLAIVQVVREPPE